MAPTPAEATEALVAGARLQDYAEQTGIALQTARTQSKQVFAKTNHHQQAALVRDVLSIGVGLGPRIRTTKRDPLVLRFGRLAFAPSELVGVAEAGRARVEA